MRNLLLACLLAFTACATTPTGGQQLTASGKIMLQETTNIGVRRYFADHPNVLARTAKIRAVVQDIQTRSTAFVSLTDLRAAIVKEIDARVSDKLDHDDLVSMANMLYAVMLDYVGTDKLDEKSVIRVNEYLGYVLAALPA